MSNTNTTDSNDPYMAMRASVWNAALRAAFARGAEAMREAAGLKPVRPCLWGHAFFERYVGAQLACFTDSGMYRDPGDPITYDVTTRLQIACGLAFGYRGKHRAALDDLLRTGPTGTNVNDLLFIWVSMR